MGELKNEIKPSKESLFYELITVWISLITSLCYVPGLLTLNYSLKKSKSKYPLIALYTDHFPLEGCMAISARGIPIQRVTFLAPKAGSQQSVEERFFFCWSKLVSFGLVEYERVVLLDCDMLVLQNMDELMNLELDGPELVGNGNRLFAAGHACICNPLKKENYPKDWTRENCAFTAQHENPIAAQTTGSPTNLGTLHILNSGLLVINPSREIYNIIVNFLKSDARLKVNFAEQSMLSELFRGRWVPLPYVYNALKTLSWDGVHSEIWRDNYVKNIHYILTPKPWEEMDTEGKSISSDSTHKWWTKMNLERLKKENEEGISSDCF
ncbi:Galactinol synthase 1 [Golovinomyces cichoracearum]|uniref:Galactinol synthase 1 n=1 Tax=Golovinomyces cichoracearum TaxID=62708 RepID=A0A420IKE4_9PEZI|nr:Galactinol synthase 1 [Golovinomyces cichoracearum]